MPFGIIKDNFWYQLKHHANSNLYGQYVLEIKLIDLFRKKTKLGMGRTGRISGQMSIGIFLF